MNEHTVSNTPLHDAIKPRRLRREFEPTTMRAQQSRSTHGPEQRKIKIEGSPSTTGAIKIVGSCPHASARPG